MEAETLEHALTLSTTEKVVYSVVSVLLVMGSGLMSGLTLGLLSLDALDLEVLKRTGSAKETHGAQKLLVVLQKPHWLLCTLLLCNAGCMEALPIFLDRLLDPVAAILLSVSAILVFGEIIPQAVCSRYGVTIGAFFAPLVRGLMWVTGVITWPLGWLLDVVLGHENPLMKRRELKAMVGLHASGAGMGGTLTVDEVNVISGALELTAKAAAAGMTPIEHVFMLSDEDVIDERMVDQLLMQGHSRVPVYRGSDRSDIAGLILVKELLRFWRSEAAPLVSELRMRPLPQLPLDTAMFDVLNFFQTGRSHMAVLLGPPGLTLEQLRKTRPRIHADDDGAARASGIGFSPDSSAHGGSCGGPGLRPMRSGDESGSSGGGGSHVSIRVGADGAAASTNGAAAGGAKRGSRLGCGVLDGLKRSSHGFRRRSSNDRPSGGLLQAEGRSESSSSGGSSGGDGGGGGGGTPMAGAADGAGGFATAAGALMVVAGRLELVGGVTSLDPVKFVPVGIITLEDVIEELMQEEILDETDTHVDNEKRTKADRAELMAQLPPRLRILLQASAAVEAAALLLRRSHNKTVAAARGQAAAPADGAPDAAGAAAGAAAAAAAGGEPLALGLRRAHSWGRGFGA